MMLDLAQAQAIPQPRPSREELQKLIEDAMQAARDAAKAQQTEVAPPSVPPFPFQPDPGIPDSVLTLVIVLASLAATTIIFGPLFRALGRRIDRRGAAAVDPAQITPRLDRIEQAIEAMAVEVERISEGQRYVTKQMHELRALPAPNPLAEPAMAQRVGEPVRRGESGT